MITMMIIEGKNIPNVANNAAGKPPNT